MKARRLASRVFKASKRFQISRVHGSRFAVHGHVSPAPQPAAHRAARGAVARPEVETGLAERLDDLVQVVLFNDDVNPMEHVVLALQRVFGHPVEIAIKIMLEAHTEGRAIAQVEDRESARRHTQQLQALHLTAVIEPV